MVEHGWLGPIEWAATSRPLPGQRICGDRSIAVEVNGTGPREPSGTFWSGAEAARTASALTAARLLADTGWATPW